MLQCNPIVVICKVHVWHARLLANLSLHKIWMWFQSLSGPSSTWVVTAAFAGAGVCTLAGHPNVPHPQAFLFFSKRIDATFLVLYVQFQPEFFNAAHILLVACSGNIHHPVGNSSPPSLYGQSASNQGKQKSKCICYMHYKERSFIQHSCSVILDSMRPDVRGTCVMLVCYAALCDTMTCQLTP